MDGYETSVEGPDVNELMAQGMSYDEAADEVLSRMNPQSVPEYLAEKGYAC